MKRRVTNAGRRLRMPLVIAIAMATIGAFAVAPAGADSPAITVTPSTGLVDGQTVDVTLSGLAAVAFETVYLSECANAYADGTPIVSLVESTDCEAFTFANVTSPSLTLTDLVVHQTGIGSGNRSCTATPPALRPCTISVTRAINGNEALGLSAPLTFAADPPPTPPIATTTSATATGAPVATGKPAYVHVAVTTADPSFVPEGTVDVKVDGNVVVSGAALVDGAADVSIGTLPIGTYTVGAHMNGGHSFAPSEATPSDLQVISATNVSIGDTTIVEGNDATKPRMAMFPVVLSRPSALATNVPYRVVAGSATAGEDYVAASGTLKFSALSGTIKWVSVKVKGDQDPESDQTFTVELDTPTNGYVIRDGSGLGTILDDDTNPAGVTTVDVGSGSIPEGDVGGTHAIKLSLTLSQAVSTPVSVTVQLASGNARHGTAKQGADWGGSVTRTVRFLANQVSRSLAIPTYADMADEPAETVDVHLIGVSGLPASALGPHKDALVTILTDE